jgi:hypothetical protein
VESAFAAIQEKFTELEKILSEWKPTSELFEVNQQAGIKPVAVSRELFNIAKTGLTISELTEGAFDITWAAMWGVWNFKKGLVMGLGGIAKGYAVDVASQMLLEKGIHNFLLKAGCDMRVQGTKEGNPWRVAIPHPRQKDLPLANLQLSNISISTSGDYECMGIRSVLMKNHLCTQEQSRSVQTCVSMVVCFNLAMWESREQYSAGLRCSFDMTVIAAARAFEFKGQTCRSPTILSPSDSIALVIVPCISLSPLPSNKTCALLLRSPHAHLAIRKPPTIPMAGSRKDHPKNLPDTNATIASTEVKASATTCKYAARRL